jgi:uncharacterized repeat protein (TIGR03803 family)
MTSSVQHRGWISGRGLRDASGAMTLAILLLLGAVTIPSAQAQTFTVIYSFTGEGGSFPQAGLVRDAAGNLYSTTANSGPNPPTYGTVFKVRKTGKEKVLYNFTGGTDGGYPYADLVRDAAGNLYGTTTEGGAISDSCNWSGSGCGTVFKVDASGVEAVLYSFTGGTTDGCNPYGGLLRDKAGNFYGTTANCGASGCGTVFEVDTNGVETLLHNFSGGSSDGAYPTRASLVGRLVRDAVWNLYGTTQYGGDSSCNASGAPYGCGTVWKLTP